MGFLEGAVLKYDCYGDEIVQWHSIPCMSKALDLDISAAKERIKSMLQ